MQTTTKETIYERVTNQIIEALEQGVIPWKKSWTEAGAPRSAVTGRPYRGVNVLLAMLHSLEHNHSTNAFITYQQAIEQGGHVRRGERGCPLVLWKPVPRRDQDECDATNEPRSFLLCRSFTVFSLEQTDGLDHLRARAGLDRPFRPIVECEEVIDGAGVPIVHGGGEAFYDPARDQITLPPRYTFHDERRYYATAMHELAHATGHPSRLARDMSGRWGGDGYAMEELVAELASGFVSGVFGIESIADTASYIASWLRVLRSDSRAIFSATSQATKASDYLLRHQVDEGN